jgi:hypothetical protein
VQQEEIIKFNTLHPPVVSEWHPLNEIPVFDIDDVEISIERYKSKFAEQLVMLLHDKVPQVMQGDPRSLPLIDAYFYRAGYPNNFSRTAIEEQLVPAIGGYIGTLLVRYLGGQWVPRRQLDESYVIIGRRAWLSFLYARHYMESNQAILNFALTRFYRTIERYAHGTEEM